MLKLKALGTGGAFNNSNSSFILYKNKNDLKEITYDESDNLLFDCGNLIFNKLLKLNYKVNHVYISHIHDDHIGSLTSLIFFNYYALGRKTYIYTAKEIQKKLKIYFELMAVDFSYNIKGSIKDIKYEFRNEKDLENHLKKISLNKNNYLVKFIKGDHGSVENYGLSIKNIESKNKLIISGDTKANINILNDIKDSLNKEEKVTILHDYSFWDNVECNIHMCETDYQEFYLRSLKDYQDSNYKFIFYHNEEPSEKINKIKI